MSTRIVLGAGCLKPHPLRWGCGCQTDGLRLMAAAARLLSAEKCFFFLCDMQSGFTTLSSSQNTIATVKRMITAASLLAVPVIATEQEGFGATLSEVKGHGNKIHFFHKTSLSMLTSEVEEFMMKEPERQSVVLFGIKAHVCVLQTALHLTREGFKVHAVADGITSPDHHDYITALERMRQAGVFVSTCESVLYELLGSSQHPSFKAVQDLLK